MADSNRPKTISLPALGAVIWVAPAVVRGLGVTGGVPEALVAAPAVGPGGPVAPCRPCGPCGPLLALRTLGTCGSWSAPKSIARSEPFATFLETTAFRFSCFVPTLCLAMLIAYAAPPRTTNRHRVETTFA